VSNIDEWKSVLEWNKIPEFKSIHSLDSERFIGCYYLPETVNEFMDKITSSIIDGYGFNHKTIIGDPGCGKTTFIYYLKSSLNKRKETSNFHMEILHIQRMVCKNDYEAVVEDRVINILSRYFSENNLQKEYETLTKDSTSNKISINNIEDFLVERKSKFKKRLIIVIDDVDETPEQTVNDSLRYLYSLVECEQISKWLIARSTTLNNYNENLISFIETKFPQRMTFPKVDLFGIIEKRVKFDNPNGINPFIPEVCHHIITTHNNDLRVSVSNSIAFLENLSPPKTAKNNPKFAGHYFLTNFTKVMTEIGVFPNIYSNAISHLFPIEKDVFLILAATNRFSSGNLSILEGHYRNIYENIHNKTFISESYLINLDMDHVNEAISLLKNNRLIIESTRKTMKGFFKLTPKGESFVRFVTENYYREHTEALSIGNNEKRHPVFWDLAEMLPEYETNTHRLTNKVRL